MPCNILAPCNTPTLKLLVFACLPGPEAVPLFVKKYSSIPPSLSYNARRIELLDFQLGDELSSDGYEPNVARRHVCRGHSSLWRHRGGRCLTILVRVCLLTMSAGL